MNTKTLTLALLTLIALLAPLASRTAQPENRASITGKLTDRATSAPLAAELGLAIHTPKGIVLKHTQANEQGEFQFTDLPAGEFHLSTKHDAYAVEHLGFALQHEETRALDFRLVKAQQVSGQVTDTDGAPLAEARVQVFYEQNATFSNSYQWEEGDARTDHAGRFSLDIHPERAFVLQASRAGFLSEASAPQTANSQITLALTRGITLTGTAKDETGQPLPDAQIQLRDERERPELTRFLPFEVLQQRQQFTVTQADGSFRFDNVRSMRYALVITHPKMQAKQQLIDATHDTQFNFSVTRHP